ncbi:MAG: ABC transporter ATP-binding protein [Actinomycetota bacterium]
MVPAVTLENVGIRYRVPRISRGGRKRRLTRGFRSRTWGVRHVTWSASTGEAVGLIGPNGAGKTTLLRTIAGVYTPDEGRLESTGRVASLLAEGGGLLPHLSGWENIIVSAVVMGATREQARELRSSIADYSQLADWLDADVRTFSSGMKARLAFAVAVAVDPDILVLDEVITVGDQEFRERSAATLLDFVNRGKTVIVSSHNVRTLSETCNRLVRMERGRVMDQGDPVVVMERYLDDHGGKMPAPGETQMSSILPRRRA